MGHKQPNTPRSQVKHCLRQLILRSRERSAALKKTGYCCTDCGVKQSKAKGKEVAIQVHHDPPLEDQWAKVVDLIMELLASPQFPVCLDCHASRHGKDQHV